MKKRLTPSTFTGFWHFNMMWHEGNNADTIKRVTYENDGSFVKLLQKVSRRNKAIENYLKGFEMSGDISPTMVASILMKYNDYKIADVRVKFIMQCITLP